MEAHRTLQIDDVFLVVTDKKKYTQKIMVPFFFDEFFWRIFPIIFLIFLSIPLFSQHFNNFRNNFPIFTKNSFSTTFWRSSIQMRRKKNWKNRKMSKFGRWNWLGSWKAVKAVVLFPFLVILNISIYCFCGFNYFCNFGNFWFIKWIEILSAIFGHAFFFFVLVILNYARAKFYQPQKKKSQLDNSFFF